MLRTTPAIALALAALLLVAPIAAAKSKDHASAPPAKSKPPKSAPPPAPTSAPTPAPSPKPEIFVIPTPVPMPVAAAPARTPVTSPSSPSSPVRVITAPSAPTLERRLAYFDAGSAILLPASTGASAASTPLAAAIEPAAAAAIVHLPAPSPASWPWAAPLLGLFAVGAVMASARLFKRSPPATASERNVTLNLAPVDVRGMLLAGKAAVEKGAFEEAIAWFSQAIRLQRDLGVAHFSKGVCLAGLGKHEEAYVALRQAYLLDPEEGAIRLELSRAAARTGRSGEAMDTLGPLLTVLPQLADDVVEDEAFTALFDHPRFLAMTGRL